MKLRVTPGRERYYNNRIRFQKILKVFGLKTENRNKEFEKLLNEKRKITEKDENDGSGDEVFEALLVFQSE